MQLRPLAPEDTVRCEELEKILFSGDDPWSAASFLSELASGRNFYLAADIEGTMVGYAGLSLLGPLEDPEFEIHTIGVDPIYQRMGIGRALMDNLMAVADHHGGPVFLEVRTDNLPAITMYESYGFEKTGIRRNYYQPSGADAFTMVRAARSAAV
ncbi:alanine acetyltransferase [Corynebacterium aquilae DSM 44791]|uniref:[Ribosomal protein bS18]-alanine N-acetyltransferase n=1 Tax=Corynebacterium aquilae DSM 44791 TaxID=1431546 RepID=A0A1L7CE21_9CORY|nr:alanine acetyltransferase [Corynebacterium aquilae DSM 44791]